MKHTRKQAVATGLFLLAILAPSWAFAAVSPEDFLPEDVRITGREMHTFNADGQTATVIVGEFGMTVGRRQLRGRDGVLWFTETVAGRQRLREITVYVEGSAEVIESAGTTTRDQAMVVRIRHRGRFSADIKTRYQTPQQDLPLYKRAVTMRASATGAGAGPLAKRPPATGVDVLATTGPAVGRPSDPTTGIKPPGIAPPAEQPKPVPINYFYDEVTSRELEGGRRVTILKGRVYISQRDRVAGVMMEMRANAAVVFSGPSRTPAGGKRADAADRPGGERAVGVYLEGDVRLTRGTRSMRGSRLYYDLVNQRAIILDAVFRMVHEQRGVPIYARADEARQLSRREVWFRNVKLSTSDFHTPTYHIGTSRAYIMDTTPYDKDGQALDKPSFDAHTSHATFNLRGFPVLYLPPSKTTGDVGEVPIRRVQIGNHGRFGFGAETDWHLFRTLGLVKPEGFDGALNFDIYDKGIGTGADVEYARETFSGMGVIYGVRDSDQKDDFGRDREDVAAPEYRGRLLWRHKQFLPDDWEVQAEMSYLCDRNFLEQYFRDEFWTGKDQDTLLYVRKQRNNWAVTGLVQARINDFLTATESAPDLAYYRVGDSVFADRATVFTEAHGGAVRYQPDDGDDAKPSELTGRADVRGEINIPLHPGPFNVVPFAYARGTYWTDSMATADLGRVIAGGGFKANMHIWRVYDGARSRLLDIHRMRHVITPEAVVFLSAGNRTADEVYPFSPDIEEHLEAFHAATVGIKQRWQTYRGAEGRRHRVDFAKLDVWGAFFDNTKDPDHPAGGRSFFDRPEYSVTRNAINAETIVNFSDATALLGDMNFDLNDSDLALANIGLAVQRDPRLRYYIGARYADHLDSAVGTMGLKYRINRKYSFAAFQQYDFAFDGGDNLVTNVSIIRRFPRWYAAVTAVIDRASDDFGVVITFWPQGAPEFRIGGSRMGTWATSDMN